VAVTIDWISVANVDEIAPGERLIVEIGRDWVVIFNVEGEFYALEDRCSHEDVPLSEGTLTDCVIECRKHGATFDITTGQHLSPPAVAPVKKFPVRVEDDTVQIGKVRR
jgi:3-phenylpropionate/trans-cinnamate dioxygenase ferredoxin subunit